MRRLEDNFQSYVAAADFARCYAMNSGNPSLLRRTSPGATTWCVDYDDGKDEAAHHQEMWALWEFAYDRDRDEIPAETWIELYGEDYDLGERHPPEWGDADDLDPSDCESNVFEPESEYG